MRVQYMLRQGDLEDAAAAELQELADKAAADGHEIDKQRFLRAVAEKLLVAAEQLHSAEKEVRAT